MEWNANFGWWRMQLSWQRSWGHIRFTVQWWTCTFSFIGGWELHAVLLSRSLPTSLPISWSHWWPQQSVEYSSIGCREFEDTFLGYAGFQYLLPSSEVNMFLNQKLYAWGNLEQRIFLEYRRELAWALINYPIVSDILDVTTVTSEALTHLFYMRGSPVQLSLQGGMVSAERRIHVLNTTKSIVDLKVVEKVCLPIAIAAQFTCCVSHTRMNTSWITVLLGRRGN